MTRYEATEQLRKAEVEERFARKHDIPIADAHGALLSSIARSLRVIAHVLIEKGEP